MLQELQFKPGEANPVGLVPYALLCEANAANQRNYGRGTGETLFAIGEVRRFISGCESHTRDREWIRSAARLAEGGEGMMP